MCWQVLCAVAADGAPLAAKPATAARLELAATPTSQSLTSPTVLTSPVEVKVSKTKKFHASEQDLKKSRRLLPVPEKLKSLTTEQTPASSVATSESTTAPLAAAEEISPLPDRELEQLKAHVEPSLLATTMFEDEKASRFRHSTLFGFPSFFKK